MNKRAVTIPVGVPIMPAAGDFLAIAVNFSSNPKVHDLALAALIQIKKPTISFGNGLLIVGTGLAVMIILEIEKNIMRRTGWLEV